MAEDVFPERPRPRLVSVAVEAVSVLLVFAESSPRIGSEAPEVVMDSVSEILAFFAAWEVPLVVPLGLEEDGVAEEEVSAAVEEVGAKIEGSFAFRFLAFSTEDMKGEEGGT